MLGLSPFGLKAIEEYSYFLLSICSLLEETGVTLIIIGRCTFEHASSVSFPLVILLVKLGWVEKTIA